MNEKQQAIAAFSDSGVFAALEWAHRSSTASTMENISVLQYGTGGRARGGSMRDLMIDLTDRVCQLDKYAPNPLDPDSGSDLLHLGLSPLHPLTDDILLPPGTVVRSTIGGTEVWRFGEWQWILGKVPFDDIHQMAWKSEIRQLVAAQQFEDDNALFSINSSADLSKGGSVRTLFLGHALDPETENTRLCIGRPRLGGLAGSSWHWLYDLLEGGPGGGRLNFDQTPLAPMPTVPQQVEDAPVRMRPKQKNPGKLSSDQE